MAHGAWGIGHRVRGNIKFIPFPFSLFPLSPSSPCPMPNAPCPMPHPDINSNKLIVK
ncbi:hypothetical protein [Nostoc linckia]|uniref:hypothetical protein n=1 Tax=Nostoc linckia TaxID=92942 RepID=UPI0015D47B6C|nr:hypothetical protein [Nostoc linckia]